MFHVKLTMEEKELVLFAIAVYAKSLKRAANGEMNLAIKQLRVEQILALDRVEGMIMMSKFEKEQEDEAKQQAPGQQGPERAKVQK